MKLDAKSLEILLKRGLGTEEISAETNVESGELVNLIQKIFSEPAAKNYCRRLAKNDKHRKTTQLAVITTDRQENISMSQDLVETHETIVVPQEETLVSLQDLKENESRLQILTAEQEAAVKATIQDYRCVLDDLSSKSNLLSSLKNQIVQLKDDIENLEERAIIVLGNHENELDKLHVLKQDLYKVRCEIARRSVVNVFAYADGTILLEAESGTVEANFEGWEDARKLLEDKYEDILNDLPLKYIKQLSKLMCLPPLEDGISYEISFDVPDLEAVYTLITQA